MDRDRVLSDKELVSIYRAAQKVGYPFGHMILIIIHTAMRRGEVGGLKRSYVTPEAITLPAELTKNGRELVLPNLINAELSTIPSVGNSDYFLPTAAGGPFCSWGKNKIRFDKLCGVSNWTLHDIRRTVRTKLAEWGCCDDATAERILGHVSAESRISTRDHAGNQRIIKDDTMMARVGKTRRSGCPVSVALDLFGDSWTLLIVRDLMFKGVTRFQDLACCEEGIASNILTDRLGRLEDHGLIEKSKDPNDARRFVYQLTDKGMDLAPVMVELILWAARHEKTDAPPPLLRQMRSNRDGFIAELRRQWTSRRRGES